MTSDSGAPGRDWCAWHHAYDEDASPLRRRLEAVQRFIAADGARRGWDFAQLATIDEAIAGAGLAVAHQKYVSPEHQERSLLGGGDLARELAVLGRLHPHRARL